MNYVQSLIQDVCNEKGIQLTLVSKKWIMILEKEDKIRYISGYKFGLNDHAGGLICDDKYALYDVLKHFLIPVAEHKIFFSHYKKESVLEYFYEHKRNIVVKVNDGTCGNGVFHVQKEEELFPLLDTLLLKNYSISLCPFYNIRNEYRFIVMNQKVELCYGKKRPIVVGDGMKSIYELLCEWNPAYFRSVTDCPNRILDKGEVYEYSWQHNLSKGSIPFWIEDVNLKKQLEEVALKVSDVLNLVFASVDLIELEDGRILVLEVNSGVMIEHFAHYMRDGEKLAKEVYSKAIDFLFQ